MSLVIDIARPSKYENIIAQSVKTKWASDVDTHIWPLESKRGFPNMERVHFDLVIPISRFYGFHFFGI